MTEDNACPVCGRSMIPGKSVTDHHLIPKLKGGKIKEPCHQVCHQKIHSVWSESELATTYNTWKIIRESPEMQPFIRWVRKKPADFIDRSKMTRDHRRRRH